MPTHTIFDHLYATASVLNWIGDDGRPREDGCLLEVDVPGIQNIIASARKAGDYRAGSTLVSLAVWGTAWRYMERHGPDILLSPTSRFNPFFYLHIKNRGYGEGAYRLYVNVVRKLLPEAINPISFIEAAPAMPGTAYLALPSCTEAREAAKFFEETLEDIRAMARGEREADLPLRGKPDGDVLKVARKALDLMPKRYLPLRVRSISIKEALPVAKEAAKEINQKAGFEVAPERLLFWALLKTLRSKPAVPHPVNWFGKGGTPSFAKLYDGPWIYSTLDPDQPAVLRLSGVLVNGVLDYDEDAKKTLGQLGVQNYNELKKVFKPKEALGPVDVLRRALYYAINKNRVESVDVIALKWHYQNGYFENCSKLNDKVKAVLDGGDAEAAFGSSEEADRALAEAPQMCGRSPNEPRPTLMYAIVRADGDNISKIVSGCLPARPEPPDAKVEGDGEQWKKDAERFKKLAEAVDAIKPEDCGSSYVVPSPAYYAALSASLMVTALRDVALVMRYGGDAVFAGGDDLLAFAPLATAFDIVIESRKAYWGDEGFHKIGSYVLPAPAAYGKSYSIRAAHA
ncbi:MAG: type III-B CRISPR-associated protein Cas10/Cmr2, partial [Thermoproteus sp.]